MERVKIRLVYPSLEDPNEYEVESVWTKKVGNTFEIDNIPFFAKNIALGDVVSCEWDDDDMSYYFDELIEVSGNSTVRLLPVSSDYIKEIGISLEKLGCSWESIENGNLIAVNIPRNVDYEIIRNFIIENKLISDYQEACLGHIHPPNA